MSHHQLAIAHILFAFGYVVIVDKSGRYYYRDNAAGCHSVYLQDDYAHVYYTNADGEGMECQFMYNDKDCFYHIIQVCN